MTSHDRNLTDPKQRTSPLEVGLLTWALPPEKSGLSRAALEIAEAVAAAGASVRVFTLDRTGRSRSGAVEIVGCGIPEQGVLAALRRLPAVGHLAAPIAFRRAVLAEHRRRPFDVIEATNWYAPAAALAWSGAIPVVTRNSTPNAVSIPRARALRGRVDRAAAVALERVSARASAGLISNTAAHGAKMAALYDVAPPGAGHAVIGLSLPADVVARGAAASYPCGEPVELLFVGRDEPRKGFDALTAALPALADLPFHLMIVGVAPTSIAHWPAAVCARVTAHHRVPDAMLHDLLASAAVVVAPSRYESFGLVYQEAMAFGRPIAACAEDPSARQFVGGTGAGLLADECTGPALASVLRRLIADAPLRRALAAASRAAGGQFTRATLGRETLAAYRSAIGSNGASNRRSSSRRAPSADMPA